MSEKLKDIANKLYTNRSLPFAALVELAGLDIKVDLAGASFSGCDLSGSDFSGADLNNVDFSNANLDYCQMSDAQIEGAVFTGASLVGVTPAQFLSKVSSGEELDDVKPEYSNRQNIETWLVSNLHEVASKLIEERSPEMERFFSDASFQASVLAFSGTFQWREQFPVPKTWLLGATPYGIILDAFGIPVYSTENLIVACFPKWFCPDPVFPSIAQHDAHQYFLDMETYHHTKQEDFSCPRPGSHIAQGECRLLWDKNGRPSVIGTPIENAIDGASKEFRQNFSKDDRGWGDISAEANDPREAHWYSSERQEWENRTFPEWYKKD